MSVQSAKAKARQILSELGSRRIPVDVKRIARKLGIEVREEKLDDDVSGLLVVKDEGAAVIGLNADHGANRKRFTTAHEIGHYVLHRGAKSLFVDEVAFFRNKASSSGEYLQEIEANSFAAELLMPADKVEAEYERLHSPLTDVVEILAKKFQVSELAMKNRLENLQLVRWIDE